MQAAERGSAVLYGVVVEDEVEFTLLELSRACGAGSEQVIELVEEGVLTPNGENAVQWRFTGSALRRARSALRLSHDLQVDMAATALLLDLLDEIAALKSSLSQLQEAHRAQGAQRVNGR